MEYNFAIKPFDGKSKNLQIYPTHFVPALAVSETKKI